MIDSNNKQSEKVFINKLWDLSRMITSSKRLTIIVVLAAVILLALLISILMKARGSSGSGTNLSTFTVRRGDLAITVTESGSIKARKSIDIKSELEGQATIISIVPEGTYITQKDVDNGKVLVELDSSNLTEQLAQREIDFAGAEASYAEAKENFDIQLKQNESDITAAELKVKFTLMDFKKYLGEIVANKFIKDKNPVQNPTDDIASLLEDPNLGGAALQRLNESMDSIKLAESRLERAADTLSWTQKLREKEYVSDTELKADELDVQSLKIQKEQAGMDLELFKRYDFPKQVEQLLSDYKEAERELERTQARARSKLAQAEARLKSSEAQFDMKKERLEKIKRQIDACVIGAPAPGLVVYGSSGDFWRRRDRPIEEGGTVYERQTIIELPDTSEMIVEIGVHESSVDKVSPGQTAKIVIDAFPDKTFHGEVLKVAPLPDPQRGWLSPDLKVYNTQVSIEGSFDFLKPGMSAKVEILVEQLDDVIIVPVQVVANREGKKVCYCLTSKRIEQQEVRTGSFNDTFVQITDGLQIGEQVLMNPPRLIGPTAVTRVKEGPKQTQEAKSKPKRERTEVVQAGKRKPERAQGEEKGEMGRFQNLSEEEKAKLKKRFENMSDEDKKKFMAKMRERANQQGQTKQD